MTRTNAAELAGSDATAQAQLVADGELTPSELVEAAFQRIERIDPEINAIPLRLPEVAATALAELAADAPFAGVPFLMKDVGARQAGQPYYAGNRALQAIDYRAEEDTVLGARFREIGLVTVGNSSTPEFGLQSNTWPLAYGPTRNPWNPAHSAGGSSGGACAAVAAGLVPIAHASDGAGSIRIPASWCGLVGLKPSRDLLLWRHRGLGRGDCEFVVARSLRDVASALDLLLPAEERQRSGDGFARALQTQPAQLRIGVCVRSPDGSRVAPDCVHAVEATAQALARLGHRVETAAPESLFQYEERALHGAVFGFLEYRECVEELEARLGREVGPDDVEPFLWELASSAVSDTTPDDANRALAWIQGWENRTRAWFDDFDLLLTPTVCEAAPTLVSLDPTSHTPVSLLERMLPHMAFTEAWNATGQPAISLPLGWSESAQLPIGVQLVAAMGHDAQLISLAATLLEQGTPQPARPPIHA